MSEQDELDEALAGEVTDPARRIASAILAEIPEDALNEVIICLQDILKFHWENVQHPPETTKVVTGVGTVVSVSRSPDLVIDGLDGDLMAEQRIAELEQQLKQVQGEPDEVFNLPPPISVRVECNPVGTRAKLEAQLAAMTTERDALLKQLQDISSTLDALSLPDEDEDTPANRAMIVRHALDYATNTIAEQQARIEAMLVQIEAFRVWLVDHFVADGYAAYYVDAALNHIRDAGQQVKT